jgi:S1-C subfamily serine protease
MPKGILICPNQSLRQLLVSVKIGNTVRIWIKGMCDMFRVAILLFALGISSPAFTPAYAAETIRMIRSLSGPAGKVVGPKFVLDEIRNRFVYPQDNSLTVYFECRAPKGNYTLTAYWKDPQGRMAGISPDAKIQTVNEELNSYWIFMIDAGKAGGIWTVEIRVNGEPVGFHSFELVMPALPQQPVVETPRIPTLDEMYRAGIASLVWVHKLDRAGLRKDTTSGFIVGSDSILTAFQSIDMAAALEIEFADGTASKTTEMRAFNRLQDWALVKAATQGRPPLPIGKSSAAVVGEQAIVFSVGSGPSRTIGAVDITGRGVVRGFGDRIHINPPLPLMSVGGPLLDNYGNVVGIIGGSVAPGMYGDHRKASGALILLRPASSLVSATPIDGIALRPEFPAASLQNLLETGILTAPLSSTPEFSFGAVTDRVGADYSYVARNQFPRNNSKIIVYTMWQAKGELNKGVISINVYDSNNKVRSTVQPQTLELPPHKLIRYQCNLGTNNIEAGLYRIDLLWNGAPIWRANIAITE